MMFALWLGWTALFGVWAPSSHPNSHSTSRIVVREARFDVELSCQTLSLIESLELDRDGNRRLEEAELELGRAAIETYLRARFELEPQPLSVGPVELALLPSGNFDDQRLRAAWSGTWETPPKLLSVRCRLFIERNPFHRDSSTLHWNDEEPASFLFAEGVDTWRFEPAAVRRPTVGVGFLRLGIEHILTGYDHIAFLLALLVAARRLRDLVWVVTAFTVAHSITLGGAALDLIDVPARLVELAIALSIAYVGAENLLVRKPRTRWLEALLFGLIHGLGFAGFLADSLLYEPLKLTALVGFNLGVECGQLAIVLALAAVLRFVPGDRRFEHDPHAWFAPAWLRLTASVAITCAGLFWFFERAGWLPWGA